MNSDRNVQRKCGFCGEGIPDSAERCPYCGSILKITFDNNRITPSENDAVKNTEGAEEEGGEQVQVEQDAEVNLNTPEFRDAVKKPENAGPDGVPVNKGGMEQRAEFKSHIQGGAYRQISGGGNAPYSSRDRNDMINPLSNGMKVFLTMLFTIIPGIGQLAGIITAIVFMNAEGDSDRKSFGVALLVGSLIMFVLACIGCFMLVITISSANQFNF